MGTTTNLLVALGVAAVWGALRAASRQLRRRRGAPPPHRYPASQRAVAAPAPRAHRVG